MLIVEDAYKLIETAKAEKTCLYWFHLNTTAPYRIPDIYEWATTTPTSVFLDSNDGLLMEIRLERLYTEDLLLPGKTLKDVNPVTIETFVRVDCFGVMGEEAYLEFKLTMQDFDSARQIYSVYRGAWKDGEWSNTEIYRIPRLGSKSNV